MKYGDGSEQMAQTTKQNHGRAALLLLLGKPRLLPLAALLVGWLPQVLARTFASLVSTKCERNNVYSSWKLAFLEPHSAFYALAVIASLNCCLINFCLTL